jgi:predicted Zn-dependent peptidase
MGKLFFRVPVVAIAFAACALGQSVTAGLAAKASVFRLSNGMQFVVVPRDTSPVLTVRMYVAAGKVDEPVGKFGIARLMEQMVRSGPLSLGSKDAAAERAALQKVEQSLDRWTEARRSGFTEDRQTPQQAELRFKIDRERAKSAYMPDFYDELLRNNSIQLSSTVQGDYTSYLWTMPSDRAEIWFKAQSEWLRQPSFRGFYEQRDRLKDRLMEELETNVAARLEREVVRAALPGSEYYSLLGDFRDLDELRLSDAEAFLRSAYRPSRITVAIVGDIGLAQARKLADLYFGKLPAGTEQTTAVPAPKTSASPAPKIVDVDFSGARLTTIAFPRPPRTHADDAVFDVIAIWIKREMSLPREKLDESHQRNVIVTPSIPGDRYKSVFMMSAPVAQGNGFEQAAKSIDALIEPLRKDLLQDAVLAAVKNQTLAYLLSRMDSSQGLAELLSDVQSRSGDWTELESEWKKISAVTAADVQRVAREYLSEANGTTIRLGAPKGSSR